MKDCPFKIKNYKHVVDGYTDPEAITPYVYSESRDKCKLIKEKQWDAMFDKCVGEKICPIFQKGDLSFIIFMEKRKQDEYR